MSQGPPLYYDPVFAGPGHSRTTAYLPLPYPRPRKGDRVIRSGIWRDGDRVRDVTINTDPRAPYPRKTHGPLTYRPPSVWVGEPATLTSLGQRQGTAVSGPAGDPVRVQVWPYQLGWKLHPEEERPRAIACARVTLEAQVRQYLRGCQRRAKTDPSDWGRHDLASWDDDPEFQAHWKYWAVLVDLRVWETCGVVNKEGF